MNYEDRLRLQHEGRAALKAQLGRIKAVSTKSDAAEAFRQGQVKALEAHIAELDRALAPQGKRRGRTV